MRRPTLATLAALAAALALTPAAAPSAPRAPAATDAAPVPLAERRTEPVVLTGDDLAGWAAPADVAVKANSLEGAECTGGAEFPIDTPLTPGDPCTHNRYEEPDASTQAVVGAAGVPVERLLGYRWDPQADGFVQVPFQVDERFVRYLSNNESGFSFYSETDQHTAYAFDREGFRWTASDPSDPCLAAPASPVATDPVPGLDSDDELVFMYRDTGPAAPPSATLPPGIVDAYEVAVADPVRPGTVTYLYVMQADEGGPTPAFDHTNGYVRYERDPDADVFLFSESSYEDYGDAPDGPWYDPATGTCHTDPGEWRQRRPGDQATVTTPRYRFRYEGRWLMTELAVSAAEDGDWSYGRDLVDQWKARAFQQRPGGETPCCGYEEEVNNWGGSSILMGERWGPVRAIRETWGADSGTNVVRREIFYRDEIRFGNWLRVHPIPPLDGIYVQWDYNATAVETYFNPFRPEGVPIDGRSDEVFGNSRVRVARDGASFDDPVIAALEEQLGADLPDLAVGEQGRCPSGLQDADDVCVNNDIDSPDPTHSGLNGLLNWEQIAGPNGTLVTRWSSKEVTPGGAAHAPLAVPYYRDDACFDDGTGSDPGPHLDPRSPDGDEPDDATWGDGQPRECWDVTRMGDPDYADDLGSERFYQGSIGTHGLHLLAIVDSDNAHTTLPVTEIVSEQRVAVLPPTLANVGERYGRAFEEPLVATAAPAALAPSGGQWVAGDLHVHTTYSHDSWDPATEPHYDPTAEEPQNEPYTLGNRPEEQFAVAAARGLDYLAITDHNDVRAVDHFGAARDLGLIPVPGFENSLDGHAQMLGATSVDDYRSLGSSTDGVRAQAALLRERGGVFQVNHPAEGYTERGDLALGELDWGYGYDIQPDTVEVWNISHLWQPPLPSASSNDDAVRYWEGWLDRGARVGATGGSDNHYKSTLAVQGPGQPTTWVFVEEPTVAGVLAGLRAGRTFVSHQPPALGGPQLFLRADDDGDRDYEAMVGDTVEPDSSLAVRVVGGAGATVRVIAGNAAGERGAFSHAIEHPDYTWETAVPLPDATWVRAELVEPDSPVDGDAQGLRRTTCDPVVGGETTYCRNRLGVLAMTSAIYLRPDLAPTALAIEAPDAGQHTDAVTVGVQLTSAGAPVAGRDVRVRLGGVSAVARTGADGAATVTLPLSDPPGAYTLAAAFAGDDAYAQSEASRPFAIVREGTVLDYVGETEARGETVELAARLGEDDAGGADAPPVVGREVVFTVGARTWTATTGDDGVARVTAEVPDHGRSVEVTAAFAGDGAYEPAEDTATVTWGGGRGGGGGGAGGGGSGQGRSALLAAATSPRGGAGLLALVVLLATARTVLRVSRHP